MTDADRDHPTPPDPLIRRHLRFGWWALLAFLTMGLALEGMMGFKVQFYLSADNEMRQVMWRLAHSHGALFSIVNIAFAFTLAAAPGVVGRFGPLASRLLMLATVLMPAGFFLGGAVLYAGDPGLGVLLAPVGGVAMLLGVLLIAWRLSTSAPADHRATPNEPTAGRRAAKTIGRNRNAGAPRRGRAAPAG